MRPILYILAFVTIASCNNSPTASKMENIAIKKDSATAKKSIKDYLSVCLVNPSSYSPISWGKIDTVYLPVITPEITRLQANRDDLLYELKVGATDSTKSRIDKYNHAIDSLQKLEKHEVKRYAIKHIFKAKDEVGNIYQVEGTFYIGTDFKAYHMWCEHFEGQYTPMKYVASKYYWKKEDSVEEALNMQNKFN